MKNNFKKIRKRIFQIVEKSESGDTISLISDYFIILLIILNIAAVILSSFQEISVKYTNQLNLFETISVIIFTIEYLCRILVADFIYPETKHPRITFIFSFMPLVDLFAILPFYLPFIVRLDLRFLRILRLFRLLRILKLNRYSDAMNIIGRVLKNEKDKIVTTLFITGILLVLASSMMYYVENPAQPNKFPNIVASLWWAVATLTTVGYGDVYPVTALGKLLSGIIALLGIGLVALPTAIISAGFIRELGGKNKKICPHCGREIE